MAEFENPIEAMETMPDSDPVQRKIAQQRRRTGDFDNPLNIVGASDTARAVSSSLVAGQYIRRTFTFTPRQLARIKEIARELHISETGIARWLIDRGLGQWEQGVRPVVETKAVRLEPKLEHS